MPHMISFDTIAEIAEAKSWEIGSGERGEQNGPGKNGGRMHAEHAETNCC
jgi:hypothetical protein